MMNNTNTMSDKVTYSKHEECRQAFITEMGAARSYLASGQKPQARYHLLRANGAVAQGLIWADLLGIGESGWVDRMMEIDRVWQTAE